MRSPKTPRPQFSRRRWPISPSSTSSPSPSLLTNHRFSPIPTLLRHLRPPPLPSDLLVVPPQDLRLTTVRFCRFKIRRNSTLLPIGFPSSLFQCSKSPFFEQSSVGSG